VIEPGVARVAANAGRAFARAAVDAAQLLDVDVDQLPGDRAFIALGRLEPETSQPAHPDPRQDPRHRRERPIEHLGDLRPVIRNRLSAAITAIVCSLVRLATVTGAELRSTNPASPSKRHRASHFQAVRSLTPAASAARQTVQPSRSTRSTSNRRPIGLSRALA
jgi:hypothetical protein